MSIPPDGPGPDPDRDYGMDPYDRTRQTSPTHLPGIFLIVVAVVNILLALYLVFNGIVISSSPDYARMIVEKVQESSQAQGQPVPPLLQDPERFARLISTVDYVWAGVSIVAAILTLVGGIRMIACRSYGLAMTGSVIASIPCVSCCCLGGQGIGIWAIVVLLRPEVKAMFR